MQRLPSWHQAGWLRALGCAMCWCCVTSLPPRAAWGCPCRAVLVAQLSWDASGAQHCAVPLRSHAVPKGLQVSAVLTLCLCLTAASPLLCHCTWIIQECCTAAPNLARFLQSRTDTHTDLQSKSSPAPGSTVAFQSSWLINEVLLLLHWLLNTFTHWKYYLMDILCCLWWCSYILGEHATTILIFPFFLIFCFCFPPFSFSSCSV